MLYCKLKKKQLSNLEDVFECVSSFSKESKIDTIPPSLESETIVLESGHQPNFLPHSGFWKKLFLLDHLRKKFRGQGKNAIALFGFADYNLSTARLLTQNKIPAFNRLGYEKTGFKIPERNVWKRFDSLPKPAEEEWKKEIGKILAHYTKYPLSRDGEHDLGRLTGILEESYVQAKNFPDLNAFFISRVCSTLLGLDIYFFRYSDFQKRRIFLEEWKEIISKIGNYNDIYNYIINDQRLAIPLCTPDSLPFWYHCQCGAKVNLVLKDNNAGGTCRLCSKNHVFGMERLEEVFGDMSPNAVARNIIFSEGLGTHIFISGSGGGLVYGKISDEISRKLDFSLPETISWKSRDYYMGPAHREAIVELQRICGVEEKDITDADIASIIRDRRSRLLEMAAKAGEKEQIKKYEGQYKNMSTSIAIIKAVFDTNPSFLDISASCGIRHVLGRWEHALKGVGEEHIIINDIIYGDESIAAINKKIQEIHD